MGSLFGGASAQSNQQSGGGLFGSTTNTNTGNRGTGLFGSSAAQNSSGGGGLFGSTNNNQNQNQNQTGNTGGGLFANANNTQNQSGNTGGLFGPSTTQNQAGITGGGLFGSSATQNKPATGLFGSTTNTANNTGGTALFGASTAQTQSQTGQTTNTGGLFGANTNTGGGLFGNTNQNQNQTQNAGSSLFGGAQNNNTQNQIAGGSLFGATSLAQPQQNQSQQQQQQNLAGSIFYQPTTQVGNLGHTMSTAQLHKLQMGGISSQPNEKSVKDQITTVWKKWNPNGDGQNPATTILKTYLYNAVPKEYAPFFYPNVSLGEDEQSWEEALSQKPDPPKVDGQEVSALAYVPILCKGFEAMGRRVETQAKIVDEMRVRLHEMNNSLSAVMDAHQQRITVRIATAKKQHHVLSQRCLRLAVKVQVLRNRGYALDAAEEGLRKTLIALVKQVMDPGFAGREDEVWARMLALRERTRWLEEEGKRVMAQVDEQTRQGQIPKANGVPEEILAKTRKILKDYDGQLQHLNREMEDVEKEFAEWEASQRRQ